MRYAVLLILLSYSSISAAYVGPGLGLGAIGALLGGALAVLLAIVGLIWYPMKRLLKKNKNQTGVENQDTDA